MDGTTEPELRHTRAIRRFADRAQLFFVVAEWCEGHNPACDDPLPMIQHTSAKVRYVKCMSCGKTGKVVT